MIVVGSKALIYNFPELKREAKDTDIIAYKSDAQYLIEILKPTKIKEGKGILSLIGIRNKMGEYNTNNVEILIADESESLQKYIEYESSKSNLTGNWNKFLHYASPETLYSLKKSHIHFPIYFSKHIWDYVFLNEYFNGIDSLSNITTIKYKETEDRLGKLKTPSLNKSVKEFFGQSEGFVKSYFIHDDMHKAVAHYDEPIYLKMQIDRNMAKCDKNLWNKFSYEMKCKCVLEEAYVIALERKVLPAIFGSGKWFSSSESLEWALMRICTNLCSGWFREFATNNYHNIIEFSNKKYVEGFLEKYQSKEICRIG